MGDNRQTFPPVQVTVPENVKNADSIEVSRMYQICCRLQFHRQEENLPGHNRARTRANFECERRRSRTGWRQTPARRGEEVIGQQLYLAIARFSLHLHPASTPLHRVSLCLTCDSSIYYFGDVGEWVIGIARAGLAPIGVQFRSDLPGRPLRAPWFEVNLSSLYQYIPTFCYGLAGALV